MIHRPKTVKRGLKRLPGTRGAMHGSSCYWCTGASGPVATPTQQRMHHQPPCLSPRAPLLPFVLLLACTWAHVLGAASGRQRLLSDTGVVVTDGGCTVAVAVGAPWQLPGYCKGGGWGGWEPAACPMEARYTSLAMTVGAPCLGKWA